MVSSVFLFQFEWAWQHPHSSRRLSHVSRRSKKETSLQFHWRVVSNMLRVAPWNRLPLTARWLRQEYRMDFDPSLQPPLHIPIAFGSVRAKKMPPLPSTGEDKEVMSVCFLCKGITKVNVVKKCVQQTIYPRLSGLVHFHFPPPLPQGSEKLSCFHPSCGMISHLICLARYFLRSQPSHLLPVEGECPSCRRSVLWGSLVRHKHGCLGDLEEILPSVSQVRLVLQKKNKKKTGAACLLELNL